MQILHDVTECARGTIRRSRESEARSHGQGRACGDEDALGWPAVLAMDTPGRGLDQNRLSAPSAADA